MKLNSGRRSGNFLSRGRWLGVLWILSVLMLAGFGEVRAGGTSSTQTVQVKLDEWRMAMDQAVLNSGKVTFKAVNQGTLDHEMVVIKTEVPARTFTVKAAKVQEDAVGVVMGEIEGFPPGEMRTLTLDLPEGHYVLFCNNLEQGKSQGHYEQGMYVSFKVSPANR
ncbi:MAG: hypothetical protein ACE5F7_02680 [Nitrospiria bacterium]